MSKTKTEVEGRLIETMAKACHEANRVWCAHHDDPTQAHWDNAELWQRNSAIQGVEFRLANPKATPEAQHNAWCESKRNDGWIFGEVKDAEAKTHPCLVPYDELPEFQRKKDKLFVAIVDSLK